MKGTTMGKHVNYGGDSHFRGPNGNVLNLALVEAGVTVETVPAESGRGRAYRFRKAGKTVYTLQPSDVRDAREAVGLAGKGRTPTTVLWEHARYLANARKRGNRKATTAVESADTVTE